MATLRLRFHERTGRDRTALLAAIETRDLQALRRTSHGLAGTSGIFGFHDLGDAAQQVEDALDAGAPWQEVEANCRALIEQISSQAC